MKKFLGIVWLLLSSCMFSLIADAQSTGSLRKDWQIAQALVGMSDAQAIKVDGLKASYAYNFVTKDVTKTHAGSSSYNLVLGAQDGKLMSMFTLSYNGVAQEPAFATSGQVLGHLARHCLGVPEDVLKSLGADYGQLVNASINARGAPQKLSKTFGSVVVIWQNVQFAETNFKFVLYIANTAKPGTTGKRTTCSAKI
jgi:hypothetical protein